MNATGIVRKLDELGRIVLPVELRRSMNLREKDDIEIHVEGENIILRKFTRDCIFCGGSTGLVEYKGKLVCRRCMRSLNAKQESRSAKAAAK